MLKLIKCEFLKLKRKKFIPLIILAAFLFPIPLTYLMTTPSNKIEEQQKKANAVEPLSMNEIRALADQALKVIPERVKYYAPKVGVTYGRITIRNQRSKWGSCSSKGNLNFNCLLMLTPPEVLDSVVVHELCHRKEMNHSEKFYSEVLRVFPDYWKWDKWLKENGNLLMMRMTK